MTSNQILHVVPETALPDAVWPLISTADRTTRISVIRRAGHYGLVAGDALAPGAPVCRIDGIRINRPSRWSVQVGARVHIEADPSASLKVQIERFPWRFLNHSCDPTTRIDGVDVIALGPIQSGQELTFDYNTTEATMASPFACHCGSPRCHGTIRGFMHLPPHEQERLRPYLAAHLRRRLKRIASRPERLPAPRLARA